MIRNIVKEEPQSHESVLQEIVRSYLKVTNERLEKLSREVSHITKSLEFNQKQFEDETKVVKKDIETLLRIFFYNSCDPDSNYFSTEKKIDTPYVIPKEFHNQFKKNSSDD